MRCSQGRIFSTLATETVSHEDDVFPWRSKTASPGWSGEVGVEHPEPGQRRENRSSGASLAGVSCVDDPHVVDGAAHLAAAIVQAEVAGGRLPIQYQHLAHVDAGTLAHLQQVMAVLIVAHRGQQRGYRCRAAPGSRRCCAPPRRPEVRTRPGLESPMRRLSWLQPQISMLAPPITTA